MIEEKSRLYHCHKVRKHIQIAEYYDMINGKRTLIRSQCPFYNSGENGRECDGINDHGFKCGYANYVYNTN